MLLAYALTFILIEELTPCSMVCMQETHVVLFWHNTNEQKLFIQFINKILSVCIFFFLYCEMTDSL